MGEEKTFESAIEELELIVKELESGSVPLEKAVEYYEKGKKLKAYLEKILDNARMKISEVEETKGNV